MPPSKSLFSHSKFAAGLFDPDAPAPAGVVDPNGTPAPKRYSVYKNNVVVSYLDALAAAYPACKNLVGETFFNAIGRSYLQKVPPKSQLMILFGEGFSDFVKDYPPALQAPFLPDIAKLERAWRLAYHSADIAPISAEKLGTLPTDELGEATITFLPSVALVRSGFPVFSLWHAATNQHSLDGIDPQHAETTLIVRPDLQVDVHNIAIEFAAPIQALLAGETLNRAAETGLIENSNFDFSAMLSLLIQTGSIANIKLCSRGTK